MSLLRPKRSRAVGEVLVVAVVVDAAETQAGQSWIMVLTALREAQPRLLHHHRLLLRAVRRLRPREMMMMEERDRHPARCAELKQDLFQGRRGRLPRSFQLLVEDLRWGCTMAGIWGSANGGASIT